MDSFAEEFVYSDIIETFWLSHSIKFHAKGRRLFTCSNSFFFKKI